MKQLYSFILIFVISLNFIALKIIAQAPDWSWINNVSTNVFGEGIAIDQHDFLYVTGGFVTSPQTFGLTTLYGSNNGTSPTLFLIKYNNLGEVIWATSAKQYPLSSYNACKSYSVCVDNTDNAYITGYYSDNTLIIGSDSLINRGDKDAFIAKYDAGGNPLWISSVSGLGNEQGIDVALDNDGNLYCTGSCDTGTVTIAYNNNGSKQTTSLHTTDSIFLLKYNINGDLIWAKTIDGTIVKAMAVDKNNNAILVGYWNDTHLTFGNYSYTSIKKPEGFIVSIDPNGNVKWADVMRGLASQVIYDVDADESITILGAFGNSYSYLSFDTLYCTSCAMLLLANYDTLGNSIWHTYYENTSTVAPKKMNINDNNEIYVGGTLVNQLIFDKDTFLNGNNDIFISKFSADGKYIWAETIGGSDLETTPNLSSDSKNNLFFTGEFKSDTLVIAEDSLYNTSNFYNLIIAAQIDFSDTVSIVDTTKIYRFDNGGLYGGTAADLTYTPTNRLFSGIETPASLFASDDGATTWYQVFDNDSLEYANETRGWSGKAEKILANQSGWVAVETNRPDLKYSSVAISFSNGDTNTWKTAVDQTLLNNWGKGTQAVTSIGLSDYYLLAALGPYIVKINSGSINPNTDVTDILTSINGLQSTSTINSIALANATSGYPYYIAIDEQGSPGGYYRLLYKNDGIAFTKIVLPSTLTGIQSVYTHPNQVTGDTIFITGYDDVNKKYKIYSSFDSGINWIDISYSSATTYLSDVDYSLNWNLSASNNLVLIIPGNAISKDLGNSWEIMSDTIYHANAIKPDDINTVVGSNKVVEISTTGPSGSFTKTPSYGLEALAINKIARTESEKYFYIATKNGLGYTSAYLDTNVIAGAKWSSPYGEFPMISDTINFGAVAIDPTDSLHVIAGSGYGFYTSTTGPNGFMRIVPSGFSTNDPQVKDVVFINHTTAIAVTGGDSLYDAGKGNIWRTIDGGLTWSIVSPSGFTNGNTIALGKLGTDTIIYIGTGLLNVEPGYLWKSSDLGQTWEQIKNGPTSLAGTTHLSLPINDIAVDPRGKDTVYIAAGYGSDYAFVLSLDGGETYLYLNSYAEKPYTSIGINRTYPDTVYCASGREIYLYDLANNNFRFVYRGLPDEKIPDIMTGSILVGTTTGFYTFDPQIIDDTTITKITSKTNNDIIVNVYPNPFKDEATINIGVKENGTIAIELYDLTGRKITTIYKGKCTSGSSHYTISSDGLATGSYLVYVKINGKTGKRLLYHVK